MIKNQVKNQDKITTPPGKQDSLFFCQDPTIQGKDKRSQQLGLYIKSGSDTKDKFSICHCLFPCQLTLVQTPFAVTF